MAVSQNMASSLMQSALGATTYTGPSTWYLGLATVAPTIAGVISQEPSTTSGYQRLAIPNNQTSFTQPTFDAEHPLTYITNNIRLEMAEVTSGTEPTVNYFFLSDTQTGGTAKIWGQFDRERVLAINSVLVIEPRGAIFEMVNVD